MITATALKIDQTQAFIRPVRWDNPNMMDVSNWIRRTIEANPNALTLSRHAAQDRLEQRGFAVETVVNIVKTGHPYRVEKGSYEGEYKVNFSKSLPNGRDAAVACLVNPKSNKIVVLTVMWADRTYYKP